MFISIFGWTLTIKKWVWGVQKTDRSFPPLVSSSLPLPIALRSAAPFYDSLPPLSSIVLLVPFVNAGTTADFCRLLFLLARRAGGQWTRERKSFGDGAAGHGTTGVVLTTVLILCHDEPGHMVGRREQSISVKKRAVAFWIENRTRKATRRNLLLLEECAVLPRGGYLLNGTSDSFWRELVQS